MADACTSQLACITRRTFVCEAMRTTAAVITLSALTPREQWAAAPVRYPIPSTDGIVIDATNEVIVSRFRGHVFAFVLACPHQNTALREAKGAAGFQCPRHKSRYQPDGTFISGKATRNMDRLPIARDGNTILVDVAVAFESDREPAAWEAAFVSLTG